VRNPARIHKRICPPRNSVCDESRKRPRREDVLTKPFPSEAAKIFTQSSHFRQIGCGRQIGKHIQQTLQHPLRTASVDVGIVSQDITERLLQAVRLPLEDSELVRLHALLGERDGHRDAQFERHIETRDSVSGVREGDVGQIVD